jgi:hypothetical protein
MPKLDAFKIDNFKIDGDNINTVFTAGDVIFAASLDVVNIANKTSYNKAKDIQVEVSGTIRVSYKLANTGYGTVYANIYVNDSAVGTQRSIAYNAAAQTFSEDITVSKGDNVQVYGKCSQTVSANCAISEYMLKCAENPLANVIA